MHHYIHIASNPFFWILHAFSLSFCVFSKEWSGGYAQDKKMDLLTFASLPNMLQIWNLPLAQKCNGRICKIFSVNLAINTFAAIANFIFAIYLQMWANSFPVPWFVYDALCYLCKCLIGPSTQAIFAAIFLLLMHAIKWIDLRMYSTICAKLYIKSILLWLNHSIAYVRMRKIATKLSRVNGP